jgi:hypothetical protein
VTDPKPGAPERPADADTYEEAYREAGRVPGSLADYRHRLEVWMRDRLADLDLVERPAASERPGHGGHPEETMGPAGGWPLPHGTDGRMAAVDVDRLERAHDAEIGWLGAIRHSPTLQGLALEAAVGVGLGLLFLSSGVGFVFGVGGRAPQVGTGIAALVVSALFGVYGCRGTSRLVCALGAAARADAADGTAAEQRWRCGDCRRADRAWADGDRDVTPTAVGEWDIPARVRGVGSELPNSPSQTDGATSLEPTTRDGPNSSTETVADGGETPVAFAAAVAPDRETNAAEGADGGARE